MDTSAVVQRKKIGRPPKVTPSLKAAGNENFGVGGGIAELGDEALVAISPSTIPDEQAGVAAQVGVMDSSGECRRSSRKKIIKFDVRDLLNKHRKPHKIQIEARIDSNAPSVSSKATSSAGTDSGFIEKTSIIQRSVSFDHSQHGLTQVPIPLKTQIFKPNQASSMIVAQMQSISSASIQKHPKSIIETASTSNLLNKTEIIVPKRRGRPPKNRSLIEKPVDDGTESTIVSDVGEQNKDLSTKVLQSPTISDIKNGKESLRGRPPKNRSLTEKHAEEEKKSECIQGIAFLNEVHEQNIDCTIDKVLQNQTTKPHKSYINTEGTPEKSFQVQFEKTLCRHEVPDDSVTEIEISTSKEEDDTDELRNEFVKMEDRKPISSCDFEKDYEVKSASISVTPSKNELIDISFSNNDNDSECVSEEKYRSVVDIEQKSNIDQKTESFSEPKAAGMSHITLPLKKQLSKLQEIQAELNESESKKDAAMAFSQEKNETSLVSDETVDYEVPSKSSTPTPQRSERRSGRRLGDASNKTLEETFAEIAANSSKAILDMATQGNVESPTDNIEEIPLQSIQSDCVQSENVISVLDVQTTSIEQPSSRSMSPKEQTSDQETIPIKRRGRKPKPKVVVEEGDTNLSNVTLVEQEKSIKIDDITAIDNCTEDKHTFQPQEKTFTLENFSQEKTKVEGIFQLQQTSTLNVSTEEKLKVEGILKLQEETFTSDLPSQEKQKIVDVLKSQQGSPTSDNSSQENQNVEVILKLQKSQPTLDVKLIEQAKHHGTPPEALKPFAVENSTQAIATKDAVSIESPSKISEMMPTSAERKHKEHKTKRKERYEDLSPSAKLSSHHKRSASSDKNDFNSSKHKSPNTEKSKKHKSSDAEEVFRKETKSTESIQKLKLLSKERFGEEPISKTVSTPETSKKAREKSVDEYTKHKSAAYSLKKVGILSLEKKYQGGSDKIASIKKFDDTKTQSTFIKEKSDDEKVIKSSLSSSKERSALDSLKKSNIVSPERISSSDNYQNITSTAKEKLKSDNIKNAIILAKEKPESETPKNSVSVLKEKSALDSLKKSGLLSPENTSDGNIQKANKIIKNKQPNEDTRKSSSAIKEKLGGEGAKKYSSTSKERSTMESHVKKSSSSYKEKFAADSTKKLSSTPDENSKKSSSLTKEKACEDIAKKIVSTSKEGVAKFERAFEEALMFSPKVEKKHHDKKKHKIKSQDASSSSKSKMNASNSVGSTTSSSTTLKEHSLMTSSSSNKDQDSKSHKRKKKHKESPEASNIKDKSKSQEISNEKIQKSNEQKDEKKTLKKEIKDAKKQARKERQKKLKEAFEAAIQDDAAEKLQTQEEVQAPSLLQQEPLTLERHAEISEIISPPTPGESDSGVDIKEQITKPSSPVDQSAKPTEEKSIVVVESDPLYDIEKFIEAGVNLLKKDYKLAEDDDHGTRTQEEIAERSTDNATLMDHLTGLHSIAECAVTAHKNSSENLGTKSDLTRALDFYETPASTPASVTPSSSPTPTDNSVDTYYYSDGVRRSHRLKKITSAPKALVGRGLVRDRDRERLALRDDVETKSYYSIEDHLMDLAEVEAKNAKFLKEMEERLSNFEVIKENEYHCERIVSREARKMVCDCFLTPEEAERGELGCGEDCLNRLLMIECSVNCKVGERCTNKRFQTYLCAPCRVFRTEKKGFGIMADVEIHPGEFIMEYVGEVLDSDEFEDRRVAYSQDKNRHYYFMALRSDAIIDATIKGNVSRFINHSCDPNAETQKWTVNGELRIGFFSRKAIMPGEEITFDYQYQRYGREAQRCYCESANCRGWIGEEPASDEGEQVDDEEDDDDEDDDEDEYEEDESDVVSMVKGLMSVEDGEDEDGKDEIMSEETRRTIQDAAVKAQLRKNQTLESAETSTMKEPSLDGESDESKQKFMAYLSKISAKIELHKKSVREEKKRKRRQRKQAAIERRPPTTATARFLEDPDLEDEIDFLSRCGLKNQSDTLRLSRLMVRAKLVSTRLNLLAILRAGELPCRRLFLDYHGLHLLHGWINEDGRADMTIRMAIVETLENLPIPNKTILTESKVYQAIRGWCNDKTLPPSVKTDGNSSSPSDDSSKESAIGNAGEKQTPNVDVASTANDSESPKSELEKLALKLLNSWDNLPEIFRIPKRERIEQMKEHEREADRQYAATVEADTEDEKKEISTDRYQRDRFERRFGRPQGSRSITVLGAGALGGALNKRLTSSDVLSPEDTKHLSKEQRRELFAAKVARDEAEKRQAERRREFETKCTFFGLDPLIARHEDIPFCVSDTGKWYNDRRQIINTPPAFAHVPRPTKPMSKNPVDYFLPSAATNLPPEWAYAITEQGKIYYYHLKHRVPQWTPPTLDQINNTKWSEGESESEEYEIDETKELSEERIKEIESIETQEDLNAFLKKIVQDQRQLRYKRLVDERPISPRREEDRIYNQIEMRKYKENKEKIKKRKEEIRRRRSEAIKNSMLNMCTLGSLDDKPSTSAAVTGYSLDSIKPEMESSDLPGDALPIQDYLLSSDEDIEDIDEMKAECNNSPLLDKIVQGDKIVDELDALTTKRQLKRSLPPHREFNFDLNLSGNISSDSLYTSMEKIEHKKRKQEKKEKSKRSKESSDAKYRKLKEKFRCEIAGIIVQHLKPYRKDSCMYGRIKSNEDFNHLAKKLTHFVMIKELKYCESVGQTLVVTESVKNKSREFIRKYMAKYEAGYVKPDNDPEFKDIPYTL